MCDEVKKSTRTHSLRIFIKIHGVEINSADAAAKDASAALTEDHGESGELDDVANNEEEVVKELFRLGGALGGEEDDDEGDDANKDDAEVHLVRMKKKGMAGELERGHTRNEEE